MTRAWLPPGENWLRHRSQLPHIARWSIAPLAGAIWAIAVWAWPGLDLGNDASSRGLQPGVLIAAASVVAAVALFALAVGAIVLQAMGKYSWSVIRSALPRWLLPVMACAVGGGVVLPLWVSFSPTQWLSTAAFAGFGWSLIAVSAAVWATAQSMNPPALSARACRGVVKQLARDRPDPGRLVDAVDVLGQLAADIELPYHEGLVLMGSYTAVLADHARAASAGEMVVAIRSLGERAASAGSPSLAASVARALWVLGLDQVSNPRVCLEAYRSLTAIAVDARDRHDRDVADTALDAMASITAMLVGLGLHQVGYTGRSVLPTSLAGAGFFGRRQYPSSVPPEEVQVESKAPLPKAERRRQLGRFVEAFAESDGVRIDGLVELLQTGLLRPRDAEAAASRADFDPTQPDVYNLLCETVETLTSLLPSPQPASTAWPTGWQGHGAFDRDIQRLAELAEGLYRQGRHVPSDVVEVALELVGVRLRAEPLSKTDLPDARTDWRYPPSHSEEGGIAATTANCLGALMISAFDAGFDRRALSTGLRILASATASTSHGDLAATRAYANALAQFTLDASLRGLEARSRAGEHRMQAVLTALISEADQLISAAEQQKGRNRELYEVVTDVVDSLTWHTPRPQNLATVASTLQTQLSAAGWPVALPTGQRRMHAPDEPLSPPPPQPLSIKVLGEAEELLKDWIDHQDARPAMAAALALWAHAACALGNNSSEEVQRVARFLADQLTLHGQRRAEMPVPTVEAHEEQRPGYQELDHHLRRVISAAARWCSRADPDIAPTLPHASGPRSAHAVARWLLAQPDFENWSYRGAEDGAGTSLVTVRMPDGSRRVLRDLDLRTGDLKWGYGGHGAHELAAALVKDFLADYYKCPDCLGLITIAANMINCGSCANTGNRHGFMRAQSATLGKLIVDLPEEFELTRADLLRNLAE